MKNKSIQLAILNALTVAGVIVIATVAPNLFQIFSAYTALKKTRNDNIKRSLKSLNVKGLVKLNKTKLKLTEKGYRYLQIKDLEKITLTHLKSKDQRLRLVLFDIPIDKNKIRIIFVNKLKDLGFRYFQKSVWAINGPCEKELTKIFKLLEIEKYVRIVVGKII